MAWLFRKKEIPWLLVFVGGKGDEEEHVKKYIETGSSLLDCKPPLYEVLRISPDKTREIPDKIHLKNELSELFNEAVLNELIRSKNKVHASDVALIIDKNAFSHHDVFAATIDDSINDASIYHLICTWDDFLSSAGTRKKCYHSSCVECKEIHSPCNHSCLPRLLWLMFDRDDRVIDVFKE